MGRPITRGAPGVAPRLVLSESAGGKRVSSGGTMQRMMQDLPAVPAPPVVRRTGLTLARAAGRFWRHGDLFAGAAISFYALFSILPLAILLLVSLALIFPPDAVARNVGRLFGGLTDTDILLRTIRDAFVQERTLGWLGLATLIAAAAGVFGAVQVALDHVWEVPGRTVHLRALVGVVAMFVSLLVFVGMLLLIILSIRFLRSGQLGMVLGHPRPPRSGPLSVLGITTTLAQFITFWIGYTLLPNVRIRWRDAWQGAVVGAAIWQLIGLGLGWYLAAIADYSLLYRQLHTVIALFVWVYALACCFLFGAEFVFEWAPRHSAALARASRLRMKLEEEERRRAEHPDDRTA